MFGILSKSLIRRSQVSNPAAFETLNDCLKLFETNEFVDTKELYSSFRFLTSNSDLRNNAVKDERVNSLLKQLDSRLGTLNSSYLGNFAVKLQYLYNYKVDLRDNLKTYNVDQVKSVLEKMANTIVDKGGNIKEISQVAYVLSNFGILNHPIYDFQKQQMSLNIDSATPEIINNCLLTAYQINLKDRVYYALLCEKLSELTDRFTASDVVLTLRSLHKTGLMKGFLLKRLLILMMDNLDQFKDVQLVECCYKLASLKFLSPANFKRVYSHIKPNIDKLNRFNKLMMLSASYLSCIDTDNKDMHHLLSTVKLDKQIDIISLSDYIYSSFYYKQYGDDLQQALTNLFTYKPFNSRRYALLVKEVLDSLPEDLGITYKLSQPWEELFNNIIKTEKDWIEGQNLFKEVKLIIEQSIKFKPLEQIGKHLVHFVDHDTKSCIELEFGLLLGNSQLKLRSLDALGYKTAQVKYWEWRQLKTETAQADYISKLLRNLTNRS